MNKVKYEIYQSFNVHDNKEKELLKEFERSKRALNKLSQIQFPIENVNSCHLEVKEIIRKTKKIKDTWKNNNEFLGNNHLVFKFIIVVSYEDQEAQDFPNINEYFEDEILSAEVEKRFYDFLMILNICRVGGFNYSAGFIFKNEEILWKLDKLNLFTSDLFLYSKEMQWPKFENLGIRQTWNWFLKKVNPKKIDELSSSNLSRAFNAFSYLYEESHIINKLFWSMVGIESLYVKGNQGIAEQVKNKAQLYLGEIETFKRRLSKMYSYRSSFIHGGTDFPSFFHHKGGIGSYKKFKSELFETLLVSESLLIATLQKMAKEDRDKIEFKYIIE